MAESPKRGLTGLAGFLEKFLLISMIAAGILYMLDVHVSLRLVIFPTQYYGLFFAFVLSAIFLTKPAHGKGHRTRVPWYDIIFAVLGFAVGIYVVINWPRFTMVSQFGAPDRWIPSAVAVPLIIEACRRTLGLPFAIIAVVAVLFARFGNLVPAVFFGPDQDWPSLTEYLYLNADAVYGLITQVIATMVLAFVLFGAVLQATGGGKAMIDFALSLFGRYTGGPAKVSVVSSALFGTISGAVAANVVMTGVVTIPLMKRYGFKPSMAGAVEACASTGGQLMPPVMGAAAFIMAEWLNIPYREVVIAAFVPSFLYYLALFIQVHLEASKAGLKGLSTEKLPRFGTSLKGMWVVVVPVAILIYTLFILRWAPGKSALASTGAMLLMSLISRNTRINLPKFRDALVDAGRAMLPIGAIAAGAGVVVGALNVSGSAFAFSMMVLNMGGQNLFLILLITGVISLILGMGMPTTAIYVMVAVLIAPSLVQLGILPIAAHLFVFYFALMAFITLPVANAVFVAAPMAGAPIMETGWAAMRLGVLGFIVPFIFVYSPALMLQGNPLMFVPNFITAAGGVFFIAVGANGFFTKPVGLVRRLLLLPAGIGLLIPLRWGSPDMAFNVGGAILGLILLGPELFTMVRKRKAPAAQPQQQPETRT